MPAIEINDAAIYYESYGEEQPNRIPIVIIHQSTVDSHTDWDVIGNVARVLGFLKGRGQAYLGG